MLQSLELFKEWKKESPEQVNSRAFQKWNQKPEACRNFLVILISFSFWDVGTIRPNLPVSVGQVLCAVCSDAPWITDHTAATKDLCVYYGKLPAEGTPCLF